MDLLCDNIVEEILLRLPLKYLHRLRAVARRYNALVLCPGFGVRYWRSRGPHLSGVFLQSQTLIRPWGHRPCFLTASGSRPAATESVFASDIAFLPHLPQKQTHYRTSEGMIFIVNSSSGLLLCSRGQERPVHYYVCNPVTWQCVALPELASPPEHIYSGLLSVAANGYGNIGSFQVTLVKHPSHWHGDDGCGVDLKIFSSQSGQWSAMRVQLQLPPELHSSDLNAYYPTFLGQSGTAYWIAHNRKDTFIAYDSVYRRVIVHPLPERVANGPLNRCIGERLGGSLRYGHFDYPVFQVWDYRYQVQGENFIWNWKAVHRIGVMELMHQNPAAAILVSSITRVNDRGLTNLAKRNTLFEVIGFHPTDDIVYFNVADTVCAYYMDHGTITFMNPRQCYSEQVFPYVHPPYPVLIPEIRTPN